MEVVRDEPGQALALAETSPRMPLAVIAGLGLVILLVATPWRGLWAMLAHGAAWESLDWVGSGIWLLLGLMLLGSLLGGTRVESLSVDRDRGRVEWRVSHLAGLFRASGHLALHDLDRLSLALATRGAAAPRPREVPLRLRLRAGRGRRTLDLRVAKLNENAEIADLALRLGAAAGLPFYRVVSSNELQFEVEVVRSTEPGMKTVPTPSRRADYAHDVVVTAATAAAAEERLPAFDPASFTGSPRVTVFEPGHAVRFEKGWGPSLLLAPLVVAAFFGPLAWWRLPGLHAMPILPRLVALALITFAGIGVGLIGWFGVSAGLPRRVALDWGTRTLSVDGVREHARKPFSEIQAVELRTCAHRHRTGKNQHYTGYRCEVRAMLRPADPAAPTDVLLTQTPDHREDAHTPYVMTLPLAAELASALGVERRATQSRS